MAEFSEVIKQMNRMCDNCDLCNTNCGIKDLRGTDGCYSYVFSHPQKAEALIMDWAREHPIQTNADKFKEVFGFEPRQSVCVKPSEYCGSRCSPKECEYYNFWKQEYKEPKE